MNKKTVAVLKIIFTFSYFAILFYLVFFIARRRHSYDHDINIIPLRQTFAEFRYTAAIGRFNYYSNIFGNMLLFLPLPFILKMFLKVYRFSTVLFISVAFSVAIESLQYIFEVGVADIDDVIFNTMGACIGYYIITHVKKLLTSLIS